MTDTLTRQMIQGRIDAIRENVRERDGRELSGREVAYLRRRLLLDAGIAEAAEDLPVAPADMSKDGGDRGQDRVVGMAHEGHQDMQGHLEPPRREDTSA